MLCFIHELMLPDPTFDDFPGAVYRMAWKSVFSMKRWSWPIAFKTSRNHCKKQ